MDQKNTSRREENEVNDNLIQVLNSLPLKVLITSREGRILYGNQYFKETLNVAGENINGTLIWDLYVDPEKGKKSFFDRISQLNEEDLNSYQTEINLCNESTKWLDVKVKALGLPGFKDAVLWVASNIDLVKEMEKDLLKNKARSQAIFESVSEGIIIIDKKFRITNLNPAVERMFGYLRSDLVGKKLNTLIPALGDINQLLELDTQNGQNLKDILLDTLRQFQGHRKDGSIFPLQLNLNEINLTDETFYTCVIRDISRNKELEKELIQIAETERFKIGQELHDGVGQMLSAIGLMTKNLSRKLRSNELPGSEDLDEITEMIQEADEEIRHLAHGLAHIELQNEGLEVALKRLCERFKLISKIDCRFACTPEVKVEDRMMALHIFRIVQEAVKNALKHGDAHQILVSLQKEEDTLILTVKDDGTGLFENSTDYELKGMGLSTMRYRAELLGGNFKLENTPDGWTQVKCSFPLNNK